MIDPAGCRPMSEFIELGWLHELNRLVAHPLGVHIALWLDADPQPDGTVSDGRAVLGWHVVPLAVADLVQPSNDESFARQAALHTHVADILRGGPCDQAP